MEMSIEMKQIAHELIGTLRDLASAQADHAREQHNRNRLAAITAKKRGLELPVDLEMLAREGF